ncbi:MAG: hypothetical protein MI861_17780, partial [Pirellulales bacterium]|nr:hypothetical protein [Pirellulales bacterium]
MLTLVSTVIWNSVLALGLGSIVFLLQRHRRLKCRPGLFHFFWLVVLVRLVIPPIYSVPIFAGVPDPTGEQAETTPAALNFVFEMSDAGQDVVGNESDPAFLSMTNLLVLFAIAGSVVILVACFVRWRQIS